MACRCAPSLVALRKEVDDLFLRRDKESDGCCGDAAHAARKSDHNPDASGCAHALDIDEDIEPGRDLLWLKPILLADPRCKYVIYEGRIAYPDGTDRPYTGVNAHRHHLHLSIKPTATHDSRRWLPQGTSPTIPEENDEMETPHSKARRVFLDYLGRGPEDQAALDWAASLVRDGRLDELLAIASDSEEGKALLAARRRDAGLSAA